MKYFILKFYLILISSQLDQFINCDDDNLKNVRSARPDNLNDFYSEVENFINQQVPINEPTITPGYSYQNENNYDFRNPYEKLRFNFNNKLYDSNLDYDASENNYFKNTLQDLSQVDFDQNNYFYPNQIQPIDENWKDPNAKFYPSYDQYGQINNILNPDQELFQEGYSPDWQTLSNQFNYQDNQINNQQFNYQDDQINNPLLTVFDLNKNLAPEPIQPNENSNSQIDSYRNILDEISELNLILLKKLETFFAINNQTNFKFFNYSGFINYPGNDSQVFHSSNDVNNSRTELTNSTAKSTTVLSSTHLNNHTTISTTGENSKVTHDTTTSKNSFDNSTPFTTHETSTTSTTSTNSSEVSSHETTIKKSESEISHTFISVEDVSKGSNNNDDGKSFDDVYDIDTVSRHHRPPFVRPNNMRFMEKRVNDENGVITETSTSKGRE